MKKVKITPDETIQQFATRWGITVDAVIQANPEESHALQAISTRTGGFAKLSRNWQELNVPDDAVDSSAGGPAAVVTPPPSGRSYSNPNLDWLTYETLFNTRFSAEKDFRKPNGAFKLGLYLVPLNKLDIWVRDDLEPELLNALVAALVPEIKDPQDVVILSNVTWPWKKRNGAHAKMSELNFFYLHTQNKSPGSRNECKLYIQPYAMLPYNYFDNDSGSHALGTKIQNYELKQLHDEDPQKDPNSEHHNHWFGWKTASRSTVVRAKSVTTAKERWRTRVRKDWGGWPFTNAHRANEPEERNSQQSPEQGGAYSLAGWKATDISLKTGVEYVGNAYQGGMIHKDIIGDWLLGCMRSDYINGLHKKNGFPKDAQDGHPLVLTELITIVEKEVREHQGKGGLKYREGIQVRDISPLGKSGKVYFPPLTIPQTDLRFKDSKPPFHLLSRDWTNEDARKWRLFWKKCWAAPLGRAKAMFLLRYGLQLINPNVQNFLIEFDRSFLTNIPPDFLQEGSGLGPVRIVIRDLNDAALHRQIVWAWHGGKGAPGRGKSEWSSLAGLDVPLFKFEFGQMGQDPNYRYQEPQETGSTDELQFGPAGFQLLWQKFSVFTNGKKFQEVWNYVKNPLLSTMADWGVAHNKAFISTFEEQLGIKFTRINWSTLPDPDRYRRGDVVNYTQEFDAGEDGWEVRAAGEIQAFLEKEGDQGGLKAVLDYRDRKWSPPPSPGAVTISVIGSNGKKVQWRPVTLTNKSSQESWTDLTDEKGEIKIYGAKKSDFATKEVVVHRKIGGRDADDTVTVNVA